jgi:hypothetical protein
MRSRHRAGMDRQTRVSGSLAPGVLPAGVRSALARTFESVVERLCGGVWASVYPVPACTLERTQTVSTKRFWFCGCRVFGVGAHGTPSPTCIELRCVGACCADTPALLKIGSCLWLPNRLRASYCSRQIGQGASYSFQQCLPSRFHGLWHRVGVSVDSHGPARRRRSPTSAHCRAVLAIRVLGF